MSEQTKGRRGQMDMDAVRGLYHKFNVTRTDGSSRRGGKHHGCEYFVLDLAHDKYSIPALKAYARACRKEYPELSSDLLDIIVVLLATHAPKVSTPEGAKR